MTAATTSSTAIRCANCGEAVRHPDDRYFLHIPDGWTLDEIRTWRDEGATLAWLRWRGVRVWKRCAACHRDKRTSAA